jgi:20S proteasome subunit beta 5
LAFGAFFASVVSGEFVSGTNSFLEFQWRNPEAAEMRDVRKHGPESDIPTPPLEFAHGTTTVAFTFREGIVVAVDSRASLGTFVGSKTTHKVLPIHSHLIGTMAGGAADCSFWIRKLQAEAMFHEHTEGGRRMSVARASRLLSNALYANRRLGLSVGTMICGYDDVGDSKKTGPSPKIYYVDNTGMRIESDLFAVGSGSNYALGILDSERVRRFEMTADEAVELGIRAIRHATFRDAYSGGFINVYLVTPEHGWRQVYSEDLASLHQRCETDI